MRFGPLKPKKLVFRMFRATLKFSPKLPKIQKTQILRIVVKIAVLGVVVRIIFQFFLPYEIDDNGHFCLKNDCPGWLVKNQEPRNRDLKIYWVAGLSPRGYLNFLFFVQYGRLLNISFDYVETDTNI